jgi:hypothetical protein
LPFLLSFASLSPGELALLRQIKTNSTPIQLWLFIGKMTKKATNFYMDFCQKSSSTSKLSSPSLRLMGTLQFALKSLSYIMSGK